MPARKLKHIDELCEIWADEVQTILERSSIAYPSISTIARINEGGSRVAGSLCPEVILSSRASAVDLLYKDMRKKFQKIMHKKYFRRVQLSRNEYYFLNVIHEHIADSLPSVRRIA